MRPMYLWRCLVVYTSFMQHYTMSLLQKCLVTISEEKLSNFVLYTKLKFSYFSSHCGTDRYIYIYIYIHKMASPLCKCEYASDSKSADLTMHKLRRGTKQCQNHKKVE